MDKATIKSKTLEAFQKEIERFNDVSKWGLYELRY